MLFVTAQPRKVMEYFLNDGLEYFSEKFNEKYTNGEGVSNEPIERRYNYTPIFVSSINNKIDRLVTQTVACPSKAECLIVIETEKFDRISLCKWLQYIYFKDVNMDITYHEGMEPEFIMPSIKRDDIVKIIPFENKRKTLIESINFYKGYILTDHFARQAYRVDETQLIEKYMSFYIKKYSSLQKRFYKTFFPDKYNEAAFVQLRNDIRKFL